jgi:hypothetical protein
MHGRGVAKIMQAGGPGFASRAKGKAHLMGLGTVDDVSLAEARDAAGAARKLVRQARVRGG